MNVVAAIPTAANAYLIRLAAGIANSAHHDVTTPAAVATTRKATEYSSPRISAQEISPSAMSRGPSGVESTESYSFAYLSLKKTLNVESNTAPFIAADAIRRARRTPRTRRRV